VGEHAGTRAAGAREDGDGPGDLKRNDDAACHGDLGAEDPEQYGEHFVGEGAGVADDVAVQVLACEHSLGRMNDDAFFEQVRVEGGGREAHDSSGDAPEEGRRDRCAG